MIKTPNNINKDWIILSDALAVALKACELIEESANDAIEDRGVFRIVLAGGTTPERIYSILAEKPYDWSQWEFYLGDERCLPVSSPERNSQMALHTWLNEIDVPSENIFFIPAELGAEKAAKEYAETIKSKLPFDLVLLGMGEDGHTASLFPWHEHNEDDLTHAVYESPKPPSDRVSMSIKTLSNTHNLLLLITGENKQTAVKQWQAGDDLPISKITSLRKKIVLLDQAATN
ncbi:MAG: 6-phosphogluconolactonase [Cocleimonas sp.]|jgi:6-phosphogluconolactonase